MDYFSGDDHYSMLSSQESSIVSSQESNGSVLDLAMEEEVCTIPLLPMAVTGFDSCDALVKKCIYQKPSVQQQHTTQSDETKMTDVNDNTCNKEPASQAHLLPMSVTGFDSGDDIIKGQQFEAPLSIREIRKLQIEYDKAPKDEKDVFYFPVDSVTFQDLPDWKNPEQKRIMDEARSSKKLAADAIDIGGASSGHCFDCNGYKIVLYRYGNEVFAVDSKCPHNGGPLPLGDIEELGDGSLCVRCPWHSWRFDLDTGKCRVPSSRSDRYLEHYPVRIRSDGRLFVGMKTVSQAFFSPDNEDF